MNLIHIYHMGGGGGLWELTHQVWCFDYPCMGGFGPYLFREQFFFIVTWMLVHVSAMKMVPIETFNLLIESTQN